MAKNHMDYDSDSPNGESLFHNTVFVDTSLDTHLVLMISSSDTVYDFKEKMLRQHSEIFPRLGRVKIQSVQVKRLQHFYHLPDSMLVSSAFDGSKKSWFVFVEASCSRDHDNVRALPGPTPEKDFRVLALASCSGDDDCRDNNKTTQFSHINEVPSVNKKRKSECKNDDGFTMNKKNKIEKNIDPLIEASGKIQSDPETMKIRGKLRHDLSSDTNLMLPSPEQKAFESESIPEQTGGLEKEVYRDKSNSTAREHVPKLEKAPPPQDAKEDKLGTGFGDKKDSPEANKDEANGKLLDNDDPKVMLSKRCKPLDEVGADVTKESIPSPNFTETSSRTEAIGSVKSKKKRKAKKKAPGSTEVGTKSAPPLSSTVADTTLKDLKNDKLMNDQGMLSLLQSQKFDKSEKETVCMCNPDPQVQPSESFKPSDQIEAQEMSKGPTLSSNFSPANDVVETDSSHTIKRKKLKAKKSAAKLQDKSDIDNLDESYLTPKGVDLAEEMKDEASEGHKTIPQIDKTLRSSKDTPSGKKPGIIETSLEDRHGMQGGESHRSRKRNRAPVHPSIGEDITPMEHSNPVNVSPAKDFEGHKGLSLKNEAEVTSSKASKPLDFGEVTVNCSEPGFAGQKLDNEKGLEAMKPGASQKKKRAKRNTNHVCDSHIKHFDSDAQENESTFSGTGNESGGSKRIVSRLPDTHQLQETAIGLHDNLRDAKNDENMDTNVVQDLPIRMQVNEVRQLLPVDSDKELVNEKNIMNKMKKTKMIRQNVAETQNNSKIEGKNVSVEESAASGDKMGDREPQCDSIDRIASAQTSTGNKSTLAEVLQKKHVSVVSKNDENMDTGAVQDQPIRLQGNKVQELLPGEADEEQVNENSIKKKVKKTKKNKKIVAETRNNSKFEVKKVSFEESEVSGNKMGDRDPQCDNMDIIASAQTRTGNRSTFTEELTRKHGVSKNDKNMETGAVQDQPIRLQGDKVQELVPGESDEEQVNENSIKRKKKTKRIQENVADTQQSSKSKVKNVNFEESEVSGNKMGDREPQSDNMDIVASAQTSTGNRSTLTEVLPRKHAVSKNDKSMDTGAVQDQPTRVQVNEVQQLLSGESDEEQVNENTIKKKKKAKRIQENVAETQKSSKSEVKNVNFEESEVSGVKMGDREPQGDNMDIIASSQTSAGNRSTLTEVLPRKHAVSKNDKNMDTGAVQDQPTRVQVNEVQQLLSDEEQVNKNSIKKKKKTKRIQENLAETQKSSKSEVKNVNFEESEGLGNKMGDREPQIDNMDIIASSQTSTGNRLALAEVLPRKHAVSTNDKNMDPGAVQDQPTRVQVNEVQQLLSGESDEEQVNKNNIKKKKKTKRIKENLEETQKSSKSEGKNVGVEESSFSDDKMGDRDPQCDSRDRNASAETRTGNRSTPGNVLLRKHVGGVSKFPNLEEDLNGSRSSEVPCRDNLEGRAEIMTDIKDIAETSRDRDEINFRHYFIPPEQKQNEESSAIKVKEAIHSTKAKRKAKKPGFMSDETLKASQPRHSESDTDGNQLEESSADARGNKDLPVTKKEKSEAYGNGVKASKSHDVDEEKTPSKSIKPVVGNGPSSSRNNLSLLGENKGTVMASNSSYRAKGSKRVFQDRTNEKQQSGFNKGISAQKNLRKNDKDIVNSSQQKKNLLSAAGAIFTEDSSGSSANENHQNSDASTRTPSDQHSSSSGFSDDDSESSQFSRGNGYGGHKNSLNSKNLDPEMPLSLILKSSNRFKKAKITASQSQDPEIESEPVEFVPDSQANQ